MIHCRGVLRASCIILCVAACLLSACRRREETGRASSAPAVGALGAAMAATVDGVPIPIELVQRVADAQRVELRTARERLIQDLVAARAAERRLLDESPAVRWRLRTLLGRATLDTLAAAARAQGPPTDSEVAELTERYWRQFDRPEAVRVIHAVVRPPKKNNAANGSDRAKLVAKAVHDAVRSAKNADDFEACVRSVPNDGLEVVVERLPLFARDGRMIEGQGGMNQTFAVAAHDLVVEGDLSGIVETPFGWHVIRLLERVAASRVPLEERRAAFSEETVAKRIRTAVDARMAVRQPGSSVQIAPAAESILRQFHASLEAAQGAP